VRIVHNGLYGSIQVSGRMWNLHMPGFGALLDDQKLAATLSYVRRAWGNTASLVTPQIVRQARDEIGDREFPWRAEELTRVESGPLTTLPITPEANGDLHLPASKAAVYARDLAYRPTLDVLAPWRVQDDAAEWVVRIPSRRAYDVFVNLAADEASAGDTFLIETEGSQTTGTVLSSGSYDVFRQVPAGSLTLQPGINRILMRPNGPLRRELADVRALLLTPK